VKVVVVGQGYVGLPLAIAAAHEGHDIVGVDTDEVKIAQLNAGTSPILDVLTASIASVINNYRATSSYADVALADCVVVCVPTPLDSKREPDLSFVISACQSIAKYMKPGLLVIVESTVSPGATRGMIKDLLDQAGVEYLLAYSPERIDPANTLWSVTNTPKLVAGLTPTATGKAVDFYRSFISEVIVGSSIEVIETSKLLENSFRLVNISFINEIAEFCARMGIDVREVIAAAATKPYGFMPFYPSAGVGGHCIPVDPAYLVVKAREIGAPMRFIDLANEVNLSLPSYFVGIATGILGGLSGKKIIVVGVAYKPGVTDTRETPALTLIELLRSAGALVEWHDDLVDTWNGERSVGLSDQYDLAILVNIHEGTDLSVLGKTAVLNTRGGY
jgi:UDP-N-acetyl-D-glucosamine dehydrogenase